MYGMGDAMYEERKVTNALENLIRLFSKEELFARVKEKAETPEQFAELLEAIRYIQEKTYEENLEN